MKSFKSGQEHKKVVAYFEAQYEQCGGKEDNCVFLPSVLSLSKKLNCPPLEIHETMRTLTRKGYRFFTLDLDTPVTLWYPRNKKAS